MIDEKYKLIGTIFINQDYSNEKNIKNTDYGLFYLNIISINEATLPNCSFKILFPNMKT